MSEERFPIVPDVKAENVPLSEQLEKSRQGILERLKEWETWLNHNDNWRNIVSSFASRSNSRTSASRLTNIKLFTSYLAVGVYPPPEVLFNIAVGFADYLGKGESLESVFGVESTQKTGTPVKEEQDNQRRQEVLYQMAVYRVQHKNISIEKVAEAVCLALDITNPEPETFARQYGNAGVGKRLEKDYRTILNYQSGK